MTVIQFPDEPEIAEMRRYFEGWQPPSNAEWYKQSCDQVLPTIRLAFVTVHKTRAEVREIANGMKDEGALDELLEMFRWTSGHFLPLIELCEAARKRLIENGGGPEEISA